MPKNGIDPGREIHDHRRKTQCFRVRLRHRLRPRHDERGRRAGRGPRPHDLGRGRQGRHHRRVRRALQGSRPRREHHAERGGLRCPQATSCPCSSRPGRARTLRSSRTSAGSSPGTWTSRPTWTPRHGRRPTANVLPWYRAGNPAGIYGFHTETDRDRALREPHHVRGSGRRGAACRRDLGGLGRGRAGRDGGDRLLRGDGDGPLRPPHGRSRHVLRREVLSTRRATSSSTRASRPSRR